MSESTSSLKSELIAAIGNRIVNAPRSQQSMIGPSEIGIPCGRYLAHRLTQTNRHGASVPAWRTAVGTAVHAYLAETFDDDSRFLVERRVTVGQAGGTDIDGTSDLFDTLTGTVVDWKVVGATSLRNARANGPKEQYRVQVHAYGQGFVNQGHTVNRVAVMWLPQSGELSDAVMWSEPFDPDIVTRALNRLNGYRTLAELGAWDVLPRVENYCVTCPYRRVHADINSPNGCPGVTP